VGPNNSKGEVIDPYHIREEVTKEAKRTADKLLDNTDSMLDIASRENNRKEGLVEMCHNPASSPEIPAAI